MSVLKYLVIRNIFFVYEFLRNFKSNFEPLKSKSWYEGIFFLLQTSSLIWYWRLFLSIRSHMVMLFLLGTDMPYAWLWSISGGHFHATLKTMLTAWTAPEFMRDITWLAPSSNEVAMVDLMEKLCSNFVQSKCKWVFCQRVRLPMKVRF